MPVIIPYGIPFAVAQNTVYALPANRALLFTDATTPTVQQSSDSAFSANAALTLASGQAEVAGGFIRCTSGNITVWLKKL